MNEPDIRPLTAEHAHRHSELMAHAFGAGRIVAPPAPDAEPKDMKGIWGVFDGDDDLRAALALQDYDVHWGSNLVLPMGGIAGVATFADARGRRYVDGLLRAVLRTMRERGQVISALYPFAWAFYRRHGWDWVGEKRSLSLPLNELKAAPEGKNVRQLTGDAATVRAILEPIYTEHAKRYRGVFTSESHKWLSGDGLEHNDNRTTYVYVHETPGSTTGPDGYLLWRYPGAGENGVGRVRQLIANSPEAYRGLLSLLHYFGTQCATARLTAPSDSPLWSFLYHWDVETRIEPVFAARVVDVPAALAALPARPGVGPGAATIAIEDTYAPWNTGRWLVTASPEGIVSMEPLPASAAADPPDIELDIQAFSQAYWGSPDLGALAVAGRVLVRNDKAATFLSELLAGRPVFTLDSF